MSTEIRVPTLGESVTEATVATWFKKPGDPVAVDEMLCELETDKVTVEVPATAARTTIEYIGQDQQVETEEPGPQRRCGTTGEGKARGADLERNQIDGKTDHDRYQPAEQCEISAERPDLRQLVDAIDGQAVEVVGVVRRDDCENQGTDQSEHTTGNKHAADELVISGAEDAIDGQRSRSATDRTMGVCLRAGFSKCHELNPWIGIAPASEWLPDEPQWMVHAGRAERASFANTAASTVTASGVGNRNRHIPQPTS